MASCGWLFDDVMRQNDLSCKLEPNSVEIYDKPFVSASKLDREGLLNVGLK